MERMPVSRLRSKSTRRQFQSQIRSADCLERLEDRIVLAPLFSGNAAADFIAPDVFYAADPGGVGDVGVPNSAPAGTVSGWDVQGVFFDYDHASDTLAVGIDCAGICGDADGDGDPGHTAAYNPGTDVANLGAYESVALMLDMDGDYNGLGGNGDFEAVVGVSLESSLNNFAAYTFSGTPAAPHSGFGSRLNTPVESHRSPSSIRPDLEFLIGQFSQLPGANFSPGEAFEFQVNLFMGSIVDAGIGEEFVAAVGEAVRVSIPGAASVGDQVWEDLNGNGAQDFGEPGIPGVTVTLLDATNQPIKTTTTDASGGYLFDLLEPGEYTVAFGRPAGYIATTTGRGSVSTDSNADPTTGRSGSISLQPGEHDSNVDAGFLKPVRVGNHVWEDLNLNGIQDIGEPGVAAIPVTLHDGFGNPIASTVTDAQGKYEFSNLPPGSYQVMFALPSNYDISPSMAGSDRSVDSNIDPQGRSETVTLLSGQDDLTIDAGIFRLAALGNRAWEDLNANGIQELGEPGIPGVIVQLYDGTGSALLDTTATDSDGLYLFDNLKPGSYQVSFQAPAGFQPTRVQALTAEHKDSNVDPLTGFTGGVSLASGQRNLKIDAGYFRLAALGDRVWNDRDQDGFQDAKEPGVSGVKVNLLTGGGMIRSTSTDANGKYRFSNLKPGKYIVEFVSPGSKLSARKRGANGLRDSDPNSRTGRTSGVVLESGQFDRSVDAGLIIETPPPVTPRAGDASIAGNVYFDPNNNGVKDSGEIGIEGVTLTLTGTTNSGNPISKKTRTDSTGFYRFINLDAGTYSVSEKQPVQYRDGKDTVGSLGGTRTNDTFSNIVLKAAQSATEYNFAEGHLLAQFVSKQQFLNSTTPEDTQLGRSSEGTQARARIFRLSPASSNALVINGTKRSDRIEFRPIQQGKRVQVRVNGKVFGNYNLRKVDRVIAYGHSGNDTLAVHPSLKVDAVLYGDAGRDRLLGGSGNDILVGGDGNDNLDGRFGLDLAVGGLGRDLLKGSRLSFRPGLPSEDILITGSTPYDSLDGALMAIMDEWTSLAGFKSRVSRIQSGDNTPQLSALNVLDDRSADRVANLRKGSDWVLSGFKDNLTR